MTLNHMKPSLSGEYKSTEVTNVTFIHPCKPAPLTPCGEIRAALNMLPSVSRSPKKTPVFCSVVAVVSTIAVLLQFTYFRSQTTVLVLDNERLQEELNFATDSIDELRGKIKDNQKALENVQVQKQAVDKEKQEVTERSQVKG